MINILILLGGKSNFFNNENYPFPKPVIEIAGKTMIQLVLENFNSISKDKKFIFIVKEEDCSKYHLDKTLTLLTDGNCKIIRLTGDTKGAACSALIAIEHINNDSPLIISNGDQIIDENLSKILNEFEQKNLDGGLICFESVHPKWSYARLDSSANVIETAEKRPISKNAIAGFYYFKHGKDFINAAMKSIENDAHVDGLFYIAPVYNQLVLLNKKIGIFKIDASSYKSFYSPQKIEEYEKFLESKK